VGRLGESGKSYILVLDEFGTSTATRHSTLGARYMYLTDVFPHTQLDCQATTGIDRGKNMLLGVEVKNTLS
jgi:hypothetical protein